MLETKDLILDKAKFEDWEAMYRNVWRHPESARYMQWRVTERPEDAPDRMRRNIQWQKVHDTYFVYLKATGEAIGFAGVEHIPPLSGRRAASAWAPISWGRAMAGRSSSVSWTTPGPAARRSLSPGPGRKTPRPARLSPPWALPTLPRRIGWTTGTAGRTGS